MPQQISLFCAGDHIGIHIIHNFTIADNIIVKSFLRILLLAILIFSKSPAYAQEEGSPISPSQPYQQKILFEHFTTSDGLSNNIVWSVLQDRRGFMWFATIDGLNRYDGYKTKVFRHDPEDSHSLSTNPLRVIYEDHKGDLWIGTSGGGLNKFDRFSEKFIRYQYDQNDAYSLSGNDVRSIYEDQQGSLWIGTTSGLNLLDRKTEQFTRFKYDANLPQSISNDFVQSIVQDQNGMIWLATWGGGLNQFDPQTKNFTHFQHDPDDPNSLSSDNVSILIRDHNGVIWAGTNAGLNQVIVNDAVEGDVQFLHYKHDPNNANSLSDNTIRSMIEDQQGNLWIGTLEGGVNKFDRIRNQIVRYKQDPFVISSVSDNDIISIFEDQVGSLWMGTLGGGVNIINRYRKPFFHYYFNPSDPQSVSNNAVRSIFVDRDDVIWVGTEEGGLNRANQDTTTHLDELTFKHYQFNPDEPQSLSDNFVWSIDQDLDGILWIGTEAGGLNRFDPRTETFTHYRFQPDQSNGPSSNSIRAIHVDRSGFIWLGNRGSGLDRLDPKTETFTNFSHNPNDPNSLSANTVRVIYEDKAGNLWVGTIDGGLSLFDRVNETFTNYLNDPSDPSSLSDNSVRAILEDRAGNLWIGTWGGGLNKIDPDQGAFTHYHEKDGLANEVIWGILEDNVPTEKGGPYLWIGTNQGLSRFDPKTETFRNYDFHDGLQDNSFYSAQAMSHEGLLFFGGPNGFNVFNPNDIIDNPNIPPVVITDYQLGNKQVKIGPESVLKKSILETEELVLSHQDRVISLEFAALSYIAPQKNRYRFLLEGFDQEWTEVGSDRRFVTYTNLDPGKYVFHLTGSNNDGIWNEQGTSLGITITPPWWGTIWFRGSAVILLLGLAFGAYYWRVSSLRARSRELGDEVALKTNQLQEEIRGHEATENRLRERRDELAILLDVSRDVTSTLELEQLLNHFLKQINRVVEFDAVSIHTLEGNILELLTYQYNEKIGVTPPRILLIEEIPGFQEMLDLQNGFVISDLQMDPVLMSAIIDKSEEEFTLIPPSVRSFMATPMVIRNRGIGMLALSSTQPDLYDQDSLNLIQTLANQLAVAIENAQLYEEAQAVAVSEERNRLARDLHDSTTQALYSALLFSETGKRLTERGDLEEAAYYQSRVSDVVHDALKEMRLLVFEMRPLRLEEEDLVGALQLRLDAVESRTGVEARLHAEDLPSIPRKMNVSLYFIAQEALNNSLKYAHAETVTVTIKYENKGLNLEILDDGQGFDLEKAKDSGGMGLVNMRQRTEDLAGELWIDSKPGEGTKVVARVPLEEAE